MLSACHQPVRPGDDDDDDDDDDDGDDDDDDDDDGDDDDDDAVLKWTAAGARGASGLSVVRRVVADTELVVGSVTRLSHHTAVGCVSAPTSSTASVIANAVQVTSSPPATLIQLSFSGRVKKEV